MLSVRSRLQPVLHSTCRMLLPDLKKLVHISPSPHIWGPTCEKLYCYEQVLDDELCYKYSEYHNIYEVYATRARMFRNVYLHRFVPMGTLHPPVCYVSVKLSFRPERAYCSSLHTAVRQQAVSRTLAGIKERACQTIGGQVLVAKASACLQEGECGGAHDCGCACRRRPCVQAGRRH